jgi:hypothetical protein
MPASKEECDKEAKENRVLARQAYGEGKTNVGDRAIERALEWEKAHDSWLYRWFGL